MSAWNGLLETLHSALIDELNAKFPEEKPILGLPIRKNGFELPSGKITAFLSCRVDLRDEGSGIAFIAVEPGLQNGGGLGAEAEERLWIALLRRIPAELVRRKLTPVFSNAEVGNRLASGAATPRLVIWIPMGMARGQIYLGLGVS